jgi:hypothetical protein
MAKERRKESERWAEREGEGVLQRRQSRKARLEAASARRRPSERQLLRSYEGYEEEADFDEDGE